MPKIADVIVAIKFNIKIATNQTGTTDNFMSRHICLSIDRIARER